MPQQLGETGLLEEARVGRRVQREPGHLGAHMMQPRLSQPPLKPVWPVTRTRLPDQVPAFTSTSTALPAATIPRGGGGRAACPSAARSPRGDRRRVARRWPNSGAALLPSGWPAPGMYSRTDRSSTKKPPLIKPPSPAGFSLKARTASRFELQRSEAAGRRDGHDRRLLSVLTVESDFGSDVDVGDAVAVSNRRAHSGG